MNEVDFAVTGLSTRKPEDAVESPSGVRGEVAAKILPLNNIGAVARDLRA